MIRTPRLSLVTCSLIAVAALAACRREQPQATPDTAAPASAAMPAVAATLAAPATRATPAAVAESAAPGEHTTFDAKAFAGSFAAEGARITFDSDGGYTMRVHAQSADADIDSQGTWTLEPDSRHLLLDPSSKSEPDRRYELVSMDELRPDDGGVALHREGAR